MGLVLQKFSHLMKVLGKIYSICITYSVKSKKSGFYIHVKTQIRQMFSFAHPPDLTTPDYSGPE